jgi:hypothetical protein
LLLVVGGATSASAATGSTSLKGTGTVSAQGAGAVADRNVGIQSNQTSLRRCSFQTRGDLVDMSRGSVSGDGWWDNQSCDTDRAVVTVRLQYLSGGRWTNVGYRGKDTVRAGQRVGVGAGCVSSQENAFRTVVDVDLVGIIDSRTKLYTPVRYFSCGF